MYSLPFEPLEGQNTEQSTTDNDCFILTGLFFPPAGTKPNLKWQLYPRGMADMSLSLPPKRLIAVLNYHHCLHMCDIAGIRLAALLAAEDLLANKQGYCIWMDADGVITSYETIVELCNKLTRDNIKGFGLALSMPLNYLNYYTYNVATYKIARALHIPIEASEILFGGKDGKVLCLPGAVWGVHSSVLPEFRRAYANAMEVMYQRFRMLSRGKLRSKKTVLQKGLRGVTDEPPILVAFKALEHQGHKIHYEPHDGYLTLKLSLIHI